MSCKLTASYKTKLHDSEKKYATVLVTRCWKKLGSRYLSNLSANL